MSSREAILGKIRRTLSSGANEIERRATVSNRLLKAPKGLIPERAQLPDGPRVDLFCAQAEKVATTVVRLATFDEVPAAVADYLRSRNLPQQIRRGTDERLAGLPWGGQPQLDVSVGPSDGRDLAGLSHAFAGVAETGTLVMTSGAANPTTLNFLPEHHLVVVDAADVAGDMESVWARIRAAWGKGDMPRTVNMITGPSRSGDIEQTILLGAHGPRSLHILLVG